AIYGGFTGTETSLSERNCETNVTILSGDIGTTGDNADNAYHVVYTTGLTHSAILDGFTIQGGYEENTTAGGGGVLNSYSSSPTISNCIITGNFAYHCGAGVSNQNSSPMFINCLIFNNMTSNYGGGVFNLSSSPTFTNCTITSNSAASFGGGLYLGNSSSVIINNSIINNNPSTLGGYQIYNDADCTLTLRYSCYSNEAGDVSGGTVTATNCISSDPKFVYEGGNDYRLQGTSPCKDAGSNTYVEAPNTVITTDARGEIRVQNTTIDMGAFEWTLHIDPDETISWTGAAGPSWFTDGSWSSNTIPTASVFAIIPNATNKPVINDAVNPAVCNGIAIANEAGAKLTIGTDGKLTVTDKLTNYLADVGGLLIKSEDTDLDPATRTDRKTGSLKVLRSVSGKATIEQWVAPDESHLVSSPTANQPIVDFMNENTDIATSTTTSPFTFAMRDYNITGTAWTDYFNDSKPSTDLFGTGKGYVLLTKSPVIVPLVFKGDLNSLPVNKVAVKTGWNLIGNPFTSAISINSAASDASGGTNFIDDNPSALTGSFAAVYVWDATATPKQYLVINHTYNSSAPFYAQVGQGFFIKSAVAGNLNYTSSMQVHQGTATFKAATTPTPEIKLIASSSAGSVATVIKFIEGTTAGLDVGYDAGVFKADPTFSLYTRLVEDNGVDFQLQCLPSNQYCSLAIPVGIDSKAGSEIVFSVKTVQLDPNCKVILEDKQTNTFTDLSKGNYKAVVAANTSVSNRFYLHTGDIISGVGEQTLAETKLKAYTVRNVEIRVIGEVGNDAMATLYDGLGNEVLTKKLGAGNLNIIGLPNLMSGMYLLNINDKGTSQTIKVMVRKGN
ncbi:MAG: choice-of-anchor Q domain-containing protein, partial [Mariniphaga sp.]